MELNLSSINLMKGNYTVHTDWMICWCWLELVWAGRRRVMMVILTWQQSDRWLYPHCKYTPLLCTGHTHCLIAPLINISKTTIQACRFRVNICWHLAFNHESLATIFFSYMDNSVQLKSRQTPAKWKVILLNQSLNFPVFFICFMYMFYVF